MDFCAALNALKEGKRMKRTGWTSSIHYIYLMVSVNYNELRDGGKNTVITGDNAMIKAHRSLGTDMKWAPSQADLLSLDWEEATE